MKKFTRILIWVAGSLVALIIIAIILLKIFLPVEKIKALAVEQGKTYLGREIAVEGLDLSVWGGLGVELQKVQIGNPPGFEGEQFLAAEKVDLKLQLLPLIFGDFRVDRLIIDKPVVSLVKTASGAVNYSFAADTTLLPEQLQEIPAEGQAAAMVVSFEELEIKGGLLSYRDDSTGLSVRVAGLDLSSALENPRTGLYQSSGRLRADSVLTAQEKPYPPLSVDLNYRAAFDLSTRTLTIENVNARLNALRLQLSGQVVGMPEIRSASLSVKTDQAAIADVLSLLPPEKLAKLSDYSVAGNFALDFGLSYPLSDADSSWNYTGTASLADVRVSAKNIPGELALGKCLVDVNPDKVRLNIQDGSFDKQPLKGYLTVENFKSPVISGELSGGLDLALVQPFLPTKHAHEVSGRSKFDLKFAGPIRTVDSLVFSGDISVTGGRYKSALVPEPIENFELDAYLDRRLVNIRRLDCRFPSGQLSLKGRVTDLVPYMLADSSLKRTVSPTIETDLQGEVALAMVRPYLPPQGNPQLSGKLNLDINVATNINDLSGLRARGRIEISDASYSDSLLPEPIEQFSAAMQLKPDTIEISSLQAKFTSSDVMLKGQLVRPFPYFLPLLTVKRDTLPKPLLLFELTSRRFDLDRLFPEAVPGTGDSTILVVDSVSPIILPDIEGRGTVKADTVIYCKVEFTDVNGKVRIADRKIECYEATGKVYTGTVNGETTIDLSNFEHPQYTGQFTASQIEADDFVSRFSKFSGILFGKADFAGTFNGAGWEPKDFLNSLTLDGDLDVKSGRLVLSGSVLSSFSELASKLGKSLDKEQALRDLASGVAVRNGRVFTDSLLGKLGNLGDLSLFGSYGFDETLDYSGSVMLSEVTAGQLGGLGKLLGQKESKKVRVPFKITGSILSPKVEIDYDVLRKQVGENLLDQAVDRLLKK
jgi:ribosomal protein L31